MIELALPAGTIKEAIAAFKAGADAVYFGMKDFSARKGAGNFSEEDLSRIRRYALENGKKIYITVNTLIDDNDFPKLYETLKTIDAYGCDGLIVQDLGVARKTSLLFRFMDPHSLLFTQQAESRLCRNWDSRESCFQEN